MVPPLNPHSVLARVRRDVERNALRARNGIRLVTGARPSVGGTPKDVVWRRGRTELWHYRNNDGRVTPPLLIVFSLISRSYILDLSPGNSFVERLLQAGFDVWLLDWGVPDERDAQNRLEDYVDDYISAGIVRVLEMTGQDEVNLLGYCFGGDLTLLHAAHHPDSPLRSLTVMATPVDFRHMGPLADVFGVGGLEVANVLDPDGNVPPQVVLQGFHTLKPTIELGFTGEALLRDHIRDRDGRLKDLIVLAHYVDETWAAMATIGLAEEMDARQASSPALRSH